MKSVTPYVLGTVGAVLLGGVCLKVSGLQRDLAGAQQDAATGQYDRAAAAYDRSAPYLEYASFVPGIGNGPLNDLRARRAELYYWQHEYGPLVPEEADALGAVPLDNVDLQEIVANAVYRTRQAQAKDKETVLEALNVGINAYLTALKNATRRDDAAFNYEYLVRLRDEIDKGARKPELPEEEGKGPLGSVAVTPPPVGNPPQFKILAPLAPLELDKAGAGKGVPIPRKG